MKVARPTSLHSFLRCGWSRFPPRLEAATEAELQSSRGRGRRASICVSTEQTRRHPSADLARTAGACLLYPKSYRDALFKNHLSLHWILWQHPTNLNLFLIPN